MKTFGFGEAADRLYGGGVGDEMFKRLSKSGGEQLPLATFSKLLELCLDAYVESELSSQITLFNVTSMQLS